MPTTGTRGIPPAEPVRIAGAAQAPCDSDRILEEVPSMREQRRLAAIVAADVMGYSRLMGRDESGTLAALKALRRDVVDPRIAAHGGRIVKTTGDGLLLKFQSVVDAVRCVVEVQTERAARNADVPEDHGIAFRIGINLGDIIIDDDGSSRASTSMRPSAWHAGRSRVCPQLKEKFA